MTPTLASCSNASSPMTVWCMRTWLSTLPSAYRVPGSAAATATASEMAMPRLPLWSGSAASRERPYSVTGDGLECSVAP